MFQTTVNPPSRFPSPPGGQISLTVLKVTAVYDITFRPGPLWGPRAPQPRPGRGLCWASGHTPLPSTNDLGNWCLRGFEGGTVAMCFQPVSFWQPEAGPPTLSGSVKKDPNGQRWWPARLMEIGIRARLRVRLEVGVKVGSRVGLEDQA